MRKHESDTNRARMNTNWLARRRREGGSSLSHASQLRQGSDGQAFSILHTSPRRILNAKRLTLNARVNPRSRVQDCTRRSGFTLLELIVVLGILSILAFLVALVLDPVQMTARARDANRTSDLDALVASIEHAKTNAPAFELGGFDADGTLTNSCVGESSQTVYVSVTGIDINGTCAASPPSDLPTGWTYRCAPNDGPQDVDGTGWLPVDFTAGGGTPSISALPVDPVSTFASGFYYSYVCDRDGSYEITARMVSEDVRTAGPKDVQSNDGGDDIFVYETGSDLALNPKAPWGHWPMEDTAMNVNSGVAATYGGSADDIAGVLGRAKRKSADPGPLLTITEDRPYASPFTVVNWMYVDQQVNWNDFVTQGWVGEGMNGNVRDTGIVGFGVAIGGVQKSVASTEAVAAGGWIQMVGIFDDPNVDLYVNGSVAAPQSTGGAGAATDITAEIRVLNGPTDRAATDELMIYDRVLTAEEIAYQYEALKP